jgi:hypothetical protein
MSDVKVTDGHRRAAMEALYFSEHEEPVAQAIAAAEHRARASIIADLRGLLERSEFIGPVDYVQADSIRNLVEHLEASNA